MILICMKNPETLRVVGEKMGKRYAAAASLAEAELLAGVVDPKLILIDVFAGDSSRRAVDAIRDLRERATRANVVLMAPAVTPAVVAQAVALGAAGVVDRKEKALREVVDGVLRGARRGRVASSGH